jgi:hypothetical protein
MDASAKGFPLVSLEEKQLYILIENGDAAVE